MCFFVWYITYINSCCLSRYNIANADEVFPLKNSYAEVIASFVTNVGVKILDFPKEGEFKFHYHDHKLRLISFEDHEEEENRYAVWFCILLVLCFPQASSAAHKRCIPRCGCISAAAATSRCIPGASPLRRAAVFGGSGAPPPSQERIMAALGFSDIND